MVLQIHGLTVERMPMMNIAHDVYLKQLLKTNIFHAQISNIGSEITKT